jgi:ABC-type amino acid transport substrate-binding protein
VDPNSAPLTYCDYSTSTPTPLGFEVDLIVEGLKIIEAEYSIECADEDEDFLELMKGSNESYRDQAVIGAISILPDRIKSGLDFSIPTLNTGVALMYMEEDYESYFRYQLDYSTMWLFSILTILGTGFIILIFERVLHREAFKQTDLFSLMFDYIWMAWIYFFGSSQDIQLSQPSRLLLIFMRMFSILILAIYTGNAVLVVQTESRDKEKGDFIAKNTTTDTLYSSIAWANGMKVVNTTITTETYTQLINGEIDSIVYDRILMNEVLAVEESNIAILKEDLISMYYGAMFTDLGEDHEVKQLINAALIEVYKDYEYVKTLKNKYLDKNDADLGIEGIKIFGVSSMFDFEQSTVNSLEINELKGEGFIMLGGVVLTLFAGIFVKKTKSIYEKKRKVQNLKKYLNTAESIILKKCEMFFDRLSMKYVEAISLIEGKLFEYYKYTEPLDNLFGTAVLQVQKHKNESSDTLYSVFKKRNSILIKKKN